MAACSSLSAYHKFTVRMMKQVYNHLWAYRKWTMTATSSMNDHLAIPSTSAHLSVEISTASHMSVEVSNDSQLASGKIKKRKIVITFLRMSHPVSDDSRNNSPADMPTPNMLKCASQACPGGAATIAAICTCRLRICIHTFCKRRSRSATIRATCPLYTRCSKTAHSPCVPASPS